MSTPIKSLENQQLEKLPSFLMKNPNLVNLNKFNTFTRQQNKMSPPGNLKKEDFFQDLRKDQRRIIAFYHRLNENDYHNYASNYLPQTAQGSKFVRMVGAKNSSIKNVIHV